nr:putative ribonuclease H-like domain-containing protein [Tanacetum cinerariifolium]
MGLPIKWIYTMSDFNRPKHIPAKINFAKAGESVKLVKFVKHVKHVKPVKTAEQTKKSKHFSSSPKVDRKNYNGKMTQKLGIGFGFTMKACFVCGSMSHLIKDCTYHEDIMDKKSVLSNNVGKGTGQRESRPVWNNVQRINHQNKFAPIAVFTRSRRIPVSAAKPKAAASTSAAKPVHTGGPKQSVNSRSTFHKSHSPIRRSFYNATTHSRRNSTERVNTAGSKTGHPQQALKNKGIVYSGCSRHMTRNKAYLADYQELMMEVLLLLVQVGVKLQAKGNLVRGLPSKIFENDHSCVACQKGKQHKATCKTKLMSSIGQPLQMLHMDLFGPTFVMSINHKKYCLEVTGDFSRFSWVFFLATKDESSKVLKPFITTIENQINKKVKVIRCDNGTEFKNRDLDEFCEMKGIKMEYSNARTLQALVTKLHNKTLYELLNGRSPRLDFMRPFGYPEVSDQHYIVLPLWSSISSTYKNSDDKAEDDKPKDDTGLNTVIKPVNKEDQAYRDELDRLMSQEKEASDAADSLKDIVELRSTGIFTSAYDDDLDTFTSSVQSVGTEADFNNMESSTNVAQALDGESWVEVYKNKKDERGIVVRNKARLVAQQHRQKEGIDYNDIFAHVARIKATRIFFAFASFMEFIVYQMDVKSAFLYGTIEKEVYDKYVAEILKKFDFSSVRTASTPIETHKPLVKDEEAADIVGYTKSFTSLCCKADIYVSQRKSTTRGCQFLGRRLISWQCKKQTIVVTSTIEAEYVATANCYG